MLLCTASQLTRFVDEPITPSVALALIAVFTGIGIARSGIKKA